MSGASNVPKPLTDNSHPTQPPIHVPRGLPAAQLPDLDAQHSPAPGPQPSQQPYESARAKLSPTAAASLTSQRSKHQAAKSLHLLHHPARHRSAQPHITDSNLADGGIASSSSNAEPDSLGGLSAQQRPQLQSPYAMCLLEQAKAQHGGNQQTQFAEAFSTEEGQPSDLTGSPKAGQMASRPKAEHMPDTLRAGHLSNSSRSGRSDSSFRAGRLDDSLRAGQSATSPAATRFTAASNYATPKRSLPDSANTQSAELIVISPETQTQEEVEIDLLSCSPAKR